MDLEQRAFPFEVKADIDNNMFEGYASVFRNEDSYGEVIDPGAFTKTISENKSRIKVLWQHDVWQPIGLPVKMMEDNHGLYVQAKVSQTTTGKDALILMRDGVVNEMSIGFNTLKDEMGADNLRHIKEVKLWEFSPVTFAANDQALVTGVKNLDEIGPLLKRMSRLTSGLKAGKVLSDKNKQLVNDALGALTEVESALQALLAASGDGKGAADPNNSKEPANDHSEEQEIAELASQIIMEAKLSNILKEVRN